MDQGAYGLILPRVESVEAAKAAVVACRYVQRLDAADASPRGERGWDPRVAAPYWGISVEEYTELSDLWPLDPNGELLLMAMCETADGVKNLPAILREVKGIGVVWAATGDMAVSLGVGPDRGHPLVEEAVLSTLKRVRSTASRAPLWPTPRRTLTCGWSRVFNSSSPFNRTRHQSSATA